MKQKILILVLVFGFYSGLTAASGRLVNLNGPELRTAALSGLPADAQTLTIELDKTGVYNLELSFMEEGRLLKTNAVYTANSVSTLLAPLADKSGILDPDRWTAGMDYLSLAIGYQGFMLARTALTYMNVESWDVYLLGLALGTASGIILPRLALSSARPVNGAGYMAGTIMGTMLGMIYMPVFTLGVETNYSAYITTVSAFSILGGVGGLFAAEALSLTPGASLLISGYAAVGSMALADPVLLDSTFEYANTRFLGLVLGGAAGWLFSTLDHYTSGDALLKLTWDTLFAVTGQRLMDPFFTDPIPGAYLLPAAGVLASGLLLKGHNFTYQAGLTAAAFAGGAYALIGYLSPATSRTSIALQGLAGVGGLFLGLFTGGLLFPEGSVLPAQNGGNVSLDMNPGALAAAVSDPYGDKKIPSAPFVSCTIRY